MLLRLSGAVMHCVVSKQFVLLYRSARNCTQGRLSPKSDRVSSPDIVFSIIMMKFIRHEGSEHTETYNTINLKKTTYSTKLHIHYDSITFGMI